MNARTGQDVASGRKQDCGPLYWNQGIQKCMVQVEDVTEVKYPQYHEFGL